MLHILVARVRNNPLHKLQGSLIGFLQLGDAIEDSHMAVRRKAEVHHTSAQAACCSRL